MSGATAIVSVNANARALLCWELGDNFGHIERLLSFVAPLSRAGIGADLAVIQTDKLAGHPLPPGVRVVAAPAQPGDAAAAVPDTLNVIDILRQTVYADPASFIANVGRWLAIFVAHDTSHVLLDYAPTALIAARIAGLPALALDWGFWLPPNEQPLAGLRVRRRYPRAQLINIEAAAVNAINATLVHFGAATVPSTYALYAHSRALRLTFAELDHYPQREPVWYHGILPGRAGLPAPLWPAGNGRKVFVYLHQLTPIACEVLRRLSAAGCRLLVVGSVCAHPGIAGVLDGQRALLCPGGVAIARVAAEADFAVTHSSHGVSAELLWCGCALLLLPLHGEQAMLAERIHALGAARVLVDKNTAWDVEDAVASMVTDTSYSLAARRFSARYAAHRPERIFDHVARWAAST